MSTIDKKFILINQEGVQTLEVSLTSAYKVKYELNRYCETLYISRRLESTDSIGAELKDLYTGLIASTESLHSMVIESTTGAIPQMTVAINQESSIIYKVQDKPTNGQDMSSFSRYEEIEIISVIK